MALTVYAREGALIFRSEQLFSRAVRPALAPAGMALPRTLYVTHAELPDGKFSFTLQIFHPRLGLLIRQMAMFREVDLMTALWPLIVAQLAMGLFDILYHHEMTERIAWRRSQRRELKLHGARNLAYAVLFLVLGLSEPHGLLAVLVIAVLAAEVVITLIDFVEEDMSRKLPASERVTHTLLAINYGAILALLVPILVGWAVKPTAIVPVWYGIGSVLASLAALGVIIFGLRDFFAARRTNACPPRCGRAGARAAAPPARAGHWRHRLHRRRLIEALASAGHEVIVLVRDPAKAATLRPPFRVVTHLDQIASDTAIDAVVNLAGEPTAGGLWTRARRRRILGSRLRITHAVVRLIRRLEQRPAALISGSAIGWYGAWNDETLTEFDGGKRCFSHRLCEAWECAARKAEWLGVRVVRLRIGLVLGTEGGMLGNMLAPFELGLGGPMGTGRQWMSWIERDDLIRLIAHVIASPKYVGAVNATAPAPVTNADFARELGRALRRPALLRMPAFLLHGSAATSPTSCCWPDSGYCPTRPTLTASSSGTRRCQRAGGDARQRAGGANEPSPAGSAYRRVSGTKRALSAGRTACRSASRRARHSAAAFAAAARAEGPPTLAGGAAGSRPAARSTPATGGAD